MNECFCVFENLSKLDEKWVKTWQEFSLIFDPYDGQRKIVSFGAETNLKQKLTIQQ